MQAGTKVEELANRLYAWLNAREDEMASLLSDLVAIPTENPPGENYSACVELLERTLQRCGFPCRRFPFTGPAATERDKSAISLLATYGAGERSLYFHGHYDVVPAQTRAQFQSQRKGNFLFGRGSCDMKGGIVAMIYAMRALQECGVMLDGKITLTLVPDEETGGARGSNRLAQEGILGQHGVGMLLAEPTSGIIWNANRGAISMRVTVKGKPAHVGLQHQGENAFERMLRVVQRLQQLKHEVEERKTTCKTGTAHSPNSILMLGGTSGGGTNFNVVPEQCWFTLDRRINPEENLQHEKQRIVGVLEQCRQDGIPLDWEVLQEGSSSACSEEERLGQALAHTVHQVTKEAAVFEMCPGLLELRFYATQESPAYAYGPGLLSVAHGPNEYVDLRKIRDCAAIYALTAIKTLSSSATPG